MGDGIVVTTGTNTGESVYIWHNTIVEPARSGIRFRNEQGDDNQIENNLVVKSGNFFSLDTEYIDTNDLPNVSVANNLPVRTLAEAGFVNMDRDDFSLLPDSPAVDGGAALAVTADYNSKMRPQGSAADIGAFEYTP